MRRDRVTLLAHIAYAHIYGQMPVAGRALAQRLNCALAMYRARERRHGRQVA